MIVMPSNNCGFDCGLLFGRFPGRLAHLHNPDRLAEPKSGVPWALDNGVFGAWTAGKPWDERPFYAFLERYHIFKPTFAVVPDVITNREETLAAWKIHAPTISLFKTPLAIAVQDGMTPCDLDNLEPAPDVVFIGGSTSWKWRNLSTWTENFKRVHVGRVNSEKSLWAAHDSGAESCDGTGFFRGGPERLKPLINYLEHSTAGGRPQKELCI